MTPHRFESRAVVPCSQCGAPGLREAVTGGHGMVGDYTYYVEVETGLVHECPDPEAGKRSTVHPLFSAILSQWAGR